MQSTNERILKLARRQAYIRPRDVETLGISRMALARLARQGSLQRVARGLYTLPSRPVSEHTTLAQISSQYPGILICLLSALRFHDLTTQSPFEVWVAIANKARAPMPEYPPLRVVRFSGKALTSGVEDHLIEGITVRVTGVGKTVADCFKYRHNVGLDVALEALRDAWDSKRVTMDELWRYARICRVANVMRPYLDTLV